MIPHPIRLREPWQIEELSTERTVYSRRFNRPTSLDDWERVWLEIDRVMISGHVALNQQSAGLLTAGEPFAADITDLLAASNEIRVEADPKSRLPLTPASTSVYIVDAEPPGSPVGDVRLVIRSAPR